MSEQPAKLGAVGLGRRNADSASSVRANRRWWDIDADDYHSEHGDFLGDADFVWCPERLREAEAHLLGPVADLAGRQILEVGCGAAMCSRWLAGHGARPVAFDLSAGMLRHARAGAANTGLDVPLVQADAQYLPFRNESFDLAFTSFGAVPFVADSAQVMAEVARVLRPGGRWVFSVTHPIRWIFPDDPGPGGLTATTSYFDRTPYVEFDADDVPTYVEHHRTLGDRVREINAAGFRLVDLIEPSWPADLTQEWGQWSPLRGGILPGTAIYVCQL
ncbi:methyltransferase family protein [Jatrophihabitans sp. GAS493]|uniref:class I SAM-dependent methyltransferase n=1 Tax=Jatrophihabitans sp. GAS493 TaxID=1907575 RepID=UPI000BB685A6|nr:class I SAM-dependent methyltransferase [Jatrophihabitans sp. GAS493]SOD73455.1 methyltransferase family protein [Jatrophihabitans sp. GAS493]